MILLDANVLLRLTNTHDPEYQRIQRVIFQYRSVDALAIAPQSLYEFWAVATRPKEVNGGGMAIQRARHWITTCRRMFHLLREPGDLASTWASLVEKHGITGFRAHDARYVALMQHCGVGQLMTYNVKHFAPFPITIIDPSATVNPT